MSYNFQSRKQILTLRGVYSVKICGGKTFWVKFFRVKFFSGENFLGENFFDPCPLKEGGGVRGVRLVTG